MANRARISAITNIMSEGGVSTKPPRRYPMFVVLLVARSNGTRPVPAGNVQRSTKVAAHRREISPERFPAKWILFRVEHDLFGKPLHTFPDHALDSRNVQTPSNCNRPSRAYSPLAATTEPWVPTSTIQPRP